MTRTYRALLYLLLIIIAALSANLTISISTLGDVGYLKSLKLIGSGTASSYKIGSATDTLFILTPGGYGVPDTSSNLTFGSNATMYIISVNMTTEGADTGAWEWTYGATFPDLTGGGHTAFPSFRTESTDNVTAYIASQQAHAEADVPPGAESEYWKMITDAETAQLTITPPGIYTEGGTAFPGGGEAQRTADAMRLPVEFILYPLAFATSIGAGIFVMSKTHRPEKGIRGSLVLQSTTSFFVLVIWVAVGGGVISGWTLIPFGLWMLVTWIFRNPSNPVTT